MYRTMTHEKTKRKGEIETGQLPEHNQPDRAYFVLWHHIWEGNAVLRNTKSLDPSEFSSIIVQGIERLKKSRESQHLNKARKSQICFPKHDHRTGTGQLEGRA